ncbi:MAG: TetR/AcrR family transcriptional regulator [Thomasclavelia sp.]|jgi:AcrR family transcriptional regulator|nr:TetR/AcrR family transcriptional regulator [Thomasclavelia sp.]
MTTKEKIIDVSLTLFSKKGFKGTSVKDIAAGVGIKDASLYKHFKSKKEILDTIVLNIYQQIDHMSIKMGLPAGDGYEEAIKLYSNIDEDGLVELSKRVFLFYLNDSLLSRFWKMGTIEQYQNIEVSKLFSKLFYEDSITYQTGLFNEMINNNILIKGDPRVMAMAFYTPIFFLLSKYMNNQTQQEEALDILENQVREFYRIYSKNNS